MGIYEGGFECPAGTGVGCKSISDVNTLINKGEIPKGEIPKVPLGEAPPPRPDIWYAPQVKDQGANIRKQKDLPINVPPSILKPPIIKPNNQGKKHEPQLYDAGIHHKSGIRGQISGTRKIRRSVFLL